MKSTITATLVVAILALCALTLANGGALAQARPEAGRGADAGGSGAQGQGQPGERAAPPAGRAEQAPSEDGPDAQDEEPPVQGCQDRGRKLELIV